MRTKEDAIAEQIQAGKPCGHERCEFKSEIELVSAILKAPDIEQIKTITSESIETSKKTYDLLVSLRESVRGMKESFRNEMEKDYTVNENLNPFSGNDEFLKTEVSREQLQSIMDRIDQSTRTLSKMMEKDEDPRSSDSPDPESPDEAILSLQNLGKKLEQDKKEIDEYISYREDFNQNMDEAWAKVDDALKGMREAVEEMKNESDPVHTVWNRIKFTGILSKWKSFIRNRIG
jgi:chromosome segregation ATPase